MKRGWVGWVVFGLVLYVGVLVVAGPLKWDPDPLLLALVFLPLGGVAALAATIPVGAGSGWRIDPVRVPSTVGRDARFVTNLRVLENHQAAESPGHALQDRLEALAEKVLEQRYGLDLGHDRAAELLGTEFMAMVRGPARRLSPAELDRHLRRIEEL